MNIMEQNTIDEFRRVVPKDRLTHDQSWKWGFWYIRQQQSSKRAPPRDTIRFLHPTNRKLDGGRRQYPNQKILATKIDYKSAYRRGILHSITALKTATQLLDNVAAIITLRLIFGGAPCPIE